MRLATGDDLPLIREALALREPELRSRGFLGTTDIEKAMESLTLEIVRGNGYICYGFLVMVTEIEPWYNDERILQEWFTLKISPGGRGIVWLPYELEAIAKYRDCTMVVTGDTSSMLAKAWLKGGMLPYGQSFYKKV